MLCRLLLVCLLTFQRKIKAGILQSPIHQPLTDKEVEEMLRKYPELSDTFSEMDLEYRRYIQEVGSVLLSDSGLREKLDTLDNNDLSSGLIADELHKLKPELRSRLNEIKRAEVDRLLVQWRDIVKISGQEPGDVMHLDTKNLQTFEVDDFRYLLRATVSDLNKLDKMRRQAFKEHEMKKKMEEEEKINAMGREERERYLTYKNLWAEIHRERERLVRHPGSEEQFKDVWKYTDQMKDQAFNPSLFFLLHDLNNDGALDENEVKALFTRETSMLYKKEDPDFDPAKKEEEGELMREHYFDEADTNQDRMITLQEFTAHLESNGHMRKRWTSLLSRPYFTEEEFKAYLEVSRQAKDAESTESKRIGTEHSEM